MNTKTQFLNLTLAAVCGLSGMLEAADVTGDRLNIGAGHVLDALQSSISGGQNNTIQSNSLRSTIGGGGGNVIQTNASHSTIGGGNGNSIEIGAFRSTIAGGSGNSIQSDAVYSMIGGGLQNTVQANASEATIGGGHGNAVQTNAFLSTIGGGYYNMIQADSPRSTIGGGSVNVIQANSSGSIIGGGEGNVIQDNATGSTIGGGKNNTNQAGGATISGGRCNTIGRDAGCAVIPGGAYNVALADYSLAAGYRAKALNRSAFVWSDSLTDVDFASTAPYQFLIRATGGVGIGKNNPQAQLDVAGNAAFSGNVGIGTTSPQAKLDVAGKVNCTVLELTSDRAQKSGFAPVDRRAILDQVARLPLTTWHYTNEPAVRHLGPVAQDFKAAFDLGSDDKHIATVDADGVALASIQALNDKVEALVARVTALEKENARLRASETAALQKPRNLDQ